MRSSGTVEGQWRLVIGSEVELDRDDRTCADDDECSSHVTECAVSQDLGHDALSENSDHDDCNEGDGFVDEGDGVVECYRCSEAEGTQFRFCRVKDLKDLNPKMFENLDNSDEIVLAYIVLNIAATCVNSKATIAEGEMCSRASFNAFKILLQPDHVDTIAGLDSLAFFLNRLGKKEEAGQCYEECFLRRKTKLGIEHLDTRKTRIKLKNLRKTQVTKPPTDFWKTSWWDEDGFTRPKLVDYAKQCPKGHALAPRPPDLPLEPIYCRVCHADGQQALRWYMCRDDVSCCRKYAVCQACVDHLSSAPAPCISDEDAFMTVRCKLF